MLFSDPILAVVDDLIKSPPFYHPSQIAIVVYSE